MTTQPTTTAASSGYDSGATTVVISGSESGTTVVNADDNEYLRVTINIGRSFDDCDSCGMGFFASVDSPSVCPVCAMLKSRCQHCYVVHYNKLNSHWCGDCEVMCFSATGVAHPFHPYADEIECVDCRYRDDRSIADAKYECVDAFLNLNGGRTIVAGPYTPTPSGKTPPSYKIMTSPSRPAERRRRKTKKWRYLVPSDNDDSESDANDDDTNAIVPYCEKSSLHSLKTPEKKEKKSPVKRKKQKGETIVIPVAHIHLGDGDDKDEDSSPDLVFAQPIDESDDSDATIRYPPAMDPVETDLYKTLATARNQMEMWRVKTRIASDAYDEYIRMK